MFIDSLRTNFVGKTALLRTTAKTVLKTISLTSVSLMNTSKINDPSETKVNRMNSKMYKTICSSRSYRMRPGQHNLLSTISLRNPFLGKARELLLNGFLRKRIRKKSAVFPTPLTLGAIPLLDHAKELLQTFN